jgi:hypothetical protein
MTTGHRAEDEVVDEELGDGVVLEEVEAGPKVVGDIEPTAGCVLRRWQLLKCSGRCSPDALRTAATSGSQSRARIHSPAACSPQLLIDGCMANTTLRCAALRGEQRGRRLHVALSNEKRKAKRLWPQ